MNIRPLTLLTAGALAAGASAQAAPNEFNRYPDAVTFSTRLFLPTTSTGDVTVHVDGSTIQGVGTVPGAAAGRVTAMRGLVQDSDRSTAEVYGLCILADDPANPGRPDANPATELLRLSPFNTPASGTGGVAWILTVTLGTPADVLPTQGSYHMGIELSASPETSLWAGHYTSGTAGDNPKATAPNLTYGIDRTVGSLITPSPRTMRVSILTEAAVMQVGADIDVAAQRGPNPNFGVAGTYPDRARLDGVAFRVRDESAAGSPFAVFAAFTGFAPTPLPINGADGLIYLGLPLFPLAIAQGTLDPLSGEGIVTAAPYPFSGAFGQLQFQAGIVDLTTGRGRLTNAVQSDDS